MNLPEEPSHHDDDALLLIYRTMHPIGRLPEGWRDEAEGYLATFTPRMIEELRRRLEPAPHRPACSTAAKPDGTPGGEMQPCAPAEVAGLESRRRFEMEDDQPLEEERRRVLELGRQLRWVKDWDEQLAMVHEIVELQKKVYGTSDVRRKRSPEEVKSTPCHCPYRAQRPVPPGHEACGDSTESESPASGVGSRSVGLEREPALVILPAGEATPSPDD